MINAYKNENEIEQFGSGLDKQIKTLSTKDRQSLVAEDLYPNYHFQYEEVQEDQCGSDEKQAEPPLRKRRGRPKKDTPPKQRRRVLNERNPECGCSLGCRESFDRSFRERIHTEFEALL